jgi:hypothetical protein
MFGRLSEIARRLKANSITTGVLADGAGLAMCAEFSSEAIAVMLAYVRALPLVEASAYCREMAPSPILEPLLQCP